MWKIEAELAVIQHRGCREWHTCQSMWRMDEAELVVIQHSGCRE
jgi:hypothetical protein